MEEQKRYQIRTFSPENLVALFCAGSPNAHERVISRKPQITYLAKFCAKIGIQTLVFESDYVDRHFSEDYSGYYVRCYGLYQKKCSRIHYFTKEFGDDFFAGQVLAPSFAEDVGYRGFTVVKPLPETIVGRTCIAPIENHKQYILCNYRPNLFGHDLEVDSLPFQEQDHEVAACATSALWSALHGTARLFDHPILTPLQITRKALESSPIFQRSLPNDGLDIYQMAAVVRELGMEAEVLEVDAREEPAKAKFILQGAIAAYLPLGIPPVLGLDFNQTVDGTPELHAVTVSGIKTSGNIIQHPDGFLLRGTKITQIFVHDDGVGPYAPISFVGTGGMVETGWMELANGVSTPKTAYLTDLLVPLYNQIRIPFSEIIEVVMEFDGLVEGVRNHLGLELFEKLEWDVFLATGTQLKKDVVKSTVLDAEQKAKILTNGLPHYIWRAIAYVGAEPQFELICDATDLLQGRWLVDVIHYEDRLQKTLAYQFAKAQIPREEFYGTTRQIVERIADSIQ